MSLDSNETSTSTPEPEAAVDDASPASGARAIFANMHPIGFVAAGTLVLAVVYSTVLDTSYLIGNLAWWQWLVLVATVALAANHTVLNGIRVAIEKIASVGRTAAWILVWVVFAVQFFNVVTRYTNPLVDQDILIGQMTSLAWQSFGAIFLLGVGYGIRDGVNPRIDFWWADFSFRTKAWLDFVLHTALLLPFTWMACRLLIGYTGTSLGQKFDGTWPEGWKVWRTWEQSPDADQLPLGPIKALILVGFVLFMLQVIAEIIKTGFAVIGRREYGPASLSATPQRIE